MADYFYCDLQARLCRAIVDVWDNEVTQGVIQRRQRESLRGLLEARAKPGDCSLLAGSHTRLSCFLALPLPRVLPLISHRATDEPPPSGPSTTQGSSRPLSCSSAPRELAELRVLGKDKTGGRLRGWPGPPSLTPLHPLPAAPTGAEGPSGAHEELLPGDVRQALVPLPNPPTSCRRAGSP